MDIPKPQQRKTTFYKPKTKYEPAAEKKPVFETLENVKRLNTNSVMMRPTLNSRGAFVKRSVCGSPKTLEATLSRKDTFKNDYEKLKKMLK